MDKDAIKQAYSALIKAAATLANNRMLDDLYEIVENEDTVDSNILFMHLEALQDEMRVEAVALRAVADKIIKLVEEA